MTSTTFAVAFGAGGPLASLQHLGLIAALAELQKTPSEADLVVATSAGASIAARALTGNTIEELTAWATTPPSSSEREEIRKAFTLRQAIVPTSTRMAALALKSRVYWPRLPAGLAPKGRLPTAVMGLGLSDSGWPGNLRVCATLLPDGTRYVFDSRSGASLGDAVEASSAVPGVFAPKVINGDSFVDGAVSSSNSADLVAASAAELVIVSSVQTRPGRSPLRAAARRQLVAELAGRDPMSVVVLEPTKEELALAKGFPIFKQGQVRTLIALSRERCLRSLEPYLA